MIGYRGSGFKFAEVGTDAVQYAYRLNNSTVLGYTDEIFFILNQKPEFAHLQVTLQDNLQHLHQYGGGYVFVDGPGYFEQRVKFRLPFEQQPNQFIFAGLIDILHLLGSIDKV